MPIHIVGGDRFDSAGTHENPTPGLSLCMIVRDEERFLDACLASACGAVDEICIADTGSVDRTLEIARAYGAKTRQIPWTNDFSEARNASLEMATRTWILFIDADEILLPDGIPFLRAIAASEPQRVGFNLRCVNDVDEHSGGGETSHLVLRLFPNDPELRFVQPLHEYIFDPTSPLAGGVIRGTTVDVTIRHRGYLESIVVERKKMERNLAIAKAAVERHPDDAFHWYGLGQSYAFAARRPEAREPLERMRELAGPDDKRGIIAHGLAFLAEIYGNEGQAELAEARARDSLRRAPSYPNANFALALALKKQGRAEEAIAAYREAYASPVNVAKYAVVDDQICVWKAACDLGVYLSDLGRFDEAIEEMRKAVERAPDIMTVRVNLAHVLERAGRFDEAERAFADAFARHHRLDAALQHINFLLRRQRRTDAAGFIEHAMNCLAEERDRQALLEAKAQLSALQAASELEHLTKGVAAAAFGAVPGPEAPLKQKVAGALRDDRWAEAADLLLQLPDAGIEEDRLRLLCAFRLGESDARGSGLLATVSARASEHLVAVAEAVCRDGVAGVAAERRQGAIALLAAHLLRYGRHADAVRVADTALAVRP